MYVPMQPSVGKWDPHHQSQAANSPGIVDLFPSSSSELHTNGHSSSTRSIHWSDNSRSRTGLTDFPREQEELRQDQRAHSFCGPRTAVFSDLPSTRLSQDASPLQDVHPLPQYHGSSHFGVRHDQCQHSFDGFAQLHRRRLDSLEHASPTRHNQYDQNGSFSSPSSTVSDMDVVSDHDAQPLTTEGDGAKNSTALRGSNIPPKVSDATQATTTKSSRYLREIDRRTILWRLASGEKQASLAKEFRVSRSTICNLYKRRQAVWARHDENPLSLHPKRGRRKLMLAATVSEERTQSPSSLDLPKSADNLSDEDTAAMRMLPAPSVVLEVKSRALSLLLTTIRNRETSQPHFRRCCSRAMRLLLEESLPSLSDPLVSRPLYVVSLERKGSVVLETFRDIEPHYHSTSFWPLPGAHGRVERLQHDSASLEHCDVALLDLATSSVDLVCTVIRTLRGCGVQQVRLSLVSLFISPEVVSRVRQEHPSVRIFTASIDPALEDRRELSKVELASVSRAFLERFHTCSH